MSGRYAAAGRLEIERQVAELAASERYEDQTRAAEMRAHLAEHATQSAENERLRAALVGVEWACSWEEWDQHYELCPACRQDRGKPHYDDCELAKALAAKPGEGSADARAPKAGEA